MKSFVTTSIAYTNSEPHIGFLFELVAADVIARNEALKGNEIFFLTGTDEHGTKIEAAAKAAGKHPQDFVDELSAKFEQLCRDFNISNDYFVRTSDLTHHVFVRLKWLQLQKLGLLEKRAFSGLYCSGCEAFKTEKEIIDGKCVIHERAVDQVSEENWFFKLSDFSEQLLAWYETSPILPANRANEVREFVKSGLQDISFSRHIDKLTWGVKVPDDDTQVMYVWADALLNYLSGIEASGRKIEDWHPAQYQVIGKDILKFHAVYWPAILLALGYKLPEKLVVHGFINKDGKKLSKSTGNTVSPQELLDRYGAEATRYLLLRQLNFFEDSNFVWEEFDAIYNGELANGLGNLLARTVTLLKKAADGGLEVTIPEHAPQGFEEINFASSLNEIAELIKSADSWISEHKPWEWFKGGAPTAEQVSSLVAASNLSEIAAKLAPIMPNTADEIVRQLTEIESRPLFPRI